MLRELRKHLDSRQKRVLRSAWIAAGLLAVQGCVSQSSRQTSSLVRPPQHDRSMSSGDTMALLGLSLWGLGLRREAPQGAAFGRALFEAGLRRGDAEAGRSEINIHMDGEPVRQPNREHLLRAAAAALSEKDGSSALRYCSQALSVDPQDARAYYLRGTTHIYCSEDYAAAILDYTHAIQCGTMPQEYPYHMRCIAHALTSEFDKANRDAQWVLANAHDPEVIEKNRTVRSLLNQIQKELQHQAQLSRQAGITFEVVRWPGDRTENGSPRATGKMEQVRNSWEPISQDAVLKGDDIIGLNWSGTPSHTGRSVRIDIASEDGFRTDLGVHPVPEGGHDAIWINFERIRASHEEQTGGAPSLVEYSIRFWLDDVRLSGLDRSLMVDYTNLLSPGKGTPAPDVGPTQAGVAHPCVFSYMHDLDGDGEFSLPAEAIGFGQKTFTTRERVSVFGFITGNPESAVLRIRTSTGTILQEHDILRTGGRGVSHLEWEPGELEPGSYLAVWIIDGRTAANVDFTVTDE